MSEGQTTRPPTRVLVVDDERSIRVTLSAFLRADGYEVVSAEDAAEGEVLLSQEHFDVLLSDIIMPRMTGVELLSRVHEVSPGTVVIMMTGEPTVDTAVQAVRAGAYDYLAKPVSKQDLLHVVERAARLKHLTDEAQRLALANERHRENLEQLVAERTRELSERSEQLLGALNAARAVAWSVDLRGSDLIERGPVDVVFGLPPGESHADSAAFFDAIHPDDRRLLEERIAATGADQAHDLDFRAIGADGSVRWIHAQCRVTTDAEGRPSWLHGIGQDVTEQRLLRASLAQADRLASMGMLAAGVAHEINNPLTYVLYHLESVADDVHAVGDGGPIPSETTQGWYQQLSEALQGVSRIRDISRALGAFSRVEETALSPVDVHHAIDHACRMAHNEVKYRATLHTELAADLPLVLATEGKLSQVFLNLLVNAAHAMGDGGPAVNSITIRSWAEDDIVLVSVTDTGSGIPAHQLNRIFEPFFTTKPVGVGSGLGLPICRQILDGFHGGIAVQSEVGVGTTFTLRLPAISPEWAQGGEADDVASAPPARRGRLLVIDDEEPVREILREVLSADHEVVSVGSAEEAERLLADGAEPDVVVCDVMMPGRSGIDFHRQLSHERPELARRVVFITGGAFTPGCTDYLDSQPNGRLEKPFQLSALRHAVSQAMALQPADGEAER